jgi:hypothetical protein
MRSTSDPAGYEAHMKHAAETYSECVTREADREMRNPVSVEDMAIAAHGRCWSEWDTYRAATKDAFSHNARSREEMQFATDRTEAHLRQFERDTRRGVIDHIVERTLSKKAP